MRQASKRIPESAEKTVRDIRRATRRHHSAEEKIRIVLEGLRGETALLSCAARKGSIRTCTTVGRRARRSCPPPGTLRPTVVQVLIDPSLRHSLSNAVLATQAFQHDADLLFSGMMPTCGSGISGLSFQRSPVCACSLVSSLLLSGATMSQQPSLTPISSFCPTSADGLHRAVVEAESARTAIVAETAAVEE